MCPRLAGGLEILMLVFKKSWITFLDALARVFKVGSMFKIL